MYIVTSEEMRRLDRQAIETVGLPALLLMENAGRAVADEVQQFIRNQPERRRTERWLVLAGKGNNGGDGLVAARHLQEAGIAVDVAYADSPARFGADLAFQHKTASRLGIPSFVYQPDTLPWNAYTGVIDALLGTGSSGAPRGRYASLIREANGSGLPIVAVDIPSGLNADTGELHDPCIRARLTVALAFLKRGLVQYPGAETAGEVVTRPIGIPSRFAEEAGIRTLLVTERVLESHLALTPGAERPADSHKGTYGHVLLAAGTHRMSGAGLLCARASLRAGCGLATWALPASLVPHLIGRLPEVMLAGLPDAGNGDWAEVSADEVLALAEDRDALALGPGMGRYADDSQWLRAIWEGARCPLLLDADALNMLADAPDFALWPRREAPTVLTPHPGEMARLAKLTTADVQRDRIGIARRYAQEHGVTLVLKGARTVVATPKGVVYVNTTGNPGMAKGGTGDVLSGVIASLLAQGMSAEQAAVYGVWRHGAAGDRAAEVRSSRDSLLASDLIENL
ncbi:bifunctional NAD(P)H-hydrate repair enzyme Nnr [Paenibacillus sp. J31TS4]|uniref:NAD(P)H-hydrate dehydratase n=1 Tax=Paenibacillus sp. J31TS4 TaxID=2807195 RepID=UPI001B0093AF|nr:NAD(P)H-hydrate dehydratase [Paenibacillus sp. J31TS4]GIP41164.1 bifunctional NAD(P)H-hydrate repair enzyme Nnr [Paenibacillus sp. J31TS4]